MRKRSLVLLLLALVGVAMFGTGSASAYYDDIHYNLTYYIARQVGYTPKQAHRIASAAVSVDWSPATEPVQAGMRVESGVLLITPFSAIYSLPTAQEPRFRYHAFRNENDSLNRTRRQVVGPERDGPAADADLKMQEQALWNQALTLGNPGIFLHFFQDEVPHAKYGTNGGHWPVNDADQAQKHIDYGLPIGGTTDWLSARSMSEVQTLIRETASYLTEFMERTSPKQKPRPINMPQTLALAIALREANLAPTPLAGASIDVLRRAKGFSMGAGALPGILDSFERNVAAWKRVIGFDNPGPQGNPDSISPEAAIGFFANRADLSPQETENIIRQLHGPDLKPALEVTDAAMLAADWRPEPGGPVDRLPEFEQYDFDGFGRMRDPAKVTNWVLIGTLRVNVKTNAGNKDLMLAPVKVVAKVAKTRPGDEEFPLGEENTSVNGGPVTFTQVPVGEVLLEVFDSKGNRLHKEKKVLSGSDQTVDIFLKRGDLTLERHTDDIFDVTFSDTGRLASSSWDKTVVFWNLAEGKPETQLGPFPEPVYDLAYMPGFARIAGATSDGKGKGLIRIWDSATGQLLTTFSDSKGSVSALAYSPDGRMLVSADAGGRISFRNAGNGEVRAEATEHTDGVTRIAFSPDGKWVASATGNGQVIIWDAVAMKSRFTLTDFKGYKVLSVAFSSDSKWMATGTQEIANLPTGIVKMSGNVKLWDVATGKLKATLPEHGHGVFALQFSPTTNMLATRSWMGYVPNPALASSRNLLPTTTNGNATGITPTALQTVGEDDIMFWDYETGQFIDALKVYETTTKAMSFSPDGQSLAIGGTDKAIHVLDLTGIFAKRDAMKQPSAITGGAIPAGAVPLFNNVAAPAASMTSTRQPKTGELNLSSGRFEPSQWVAPAADAPMSNGTVSLNATYAFPQSVRVTSKDALMGDFDLRASFSIDELDFSSGSFFEVDMLGEPPPGDFINFSLVNPTRPTVRVLRTGQGGIGAISVASDVSTEASAVPVTTKEITLEIQRRGTEWTVSLFNPGQASGILVGKVTRQLGGKVDVEFKLEKKGSSPARVTVKSVQAALR